MQILVESAQTLEALAEKLGNAPFDFISIHGNCAVDFDRVAEVLPNAKCVHGATSCQGAMTGNGATSGVAAFAMLDPQGAYGTGFSAFDMPAHEAARAATIQALADAGRTGEQPNLIWVSATPGAEEEVLNGIESVVGAGDVPIIGGSAADNDVTGSWSVFSASDKTDNGVIVTVMFPSTKVSFAYQNGYSPTDKIGTVTRADGRTIAEIDHRPAMEVYREWTGGAVDKPAEGQKEHAILSQSTFWPLGREVSQVGDVPLYLLAHPAVAHENGSMDLFANIAEGEKITQMNGTAQSLIERAGRVAALARTGGRMQDKPIAGALMIYCGGCMLSVQDHIGEVASGVDAALGSAPFLGAFTFGEQGSLLRAGNRHGNLMISCIVFGQT
ncbi:MAG: FIST N-terminal domain-containing protein [Pseudomonadota bacterium]